MRTAARLPDPAEAVDQRRLRRELENFHLNASDTVTHAMPVAPSETRKSGHYPATFPWPCRWECSRRLAGTRISRLSTAPTPASAIG